MFQIEVWKSQESFTYFKIFKPISWGKRPAERRSRLIQRFPRFDPRPGGSCRAKCGLTPAGCEIGSHSDAKAAGFTKTCRSARQNPCVASKNRLNFRVIARPQRGRGNLKVKGMASRNEAREQVAKRNTYKKGKLIIRNMRFAASFRFLSLYSKALFRSVQP